MASSSSMNLSTNTPTPPASSPSPIPQEPLSLLPTTLKPSTTTPTTTTTTPSPQIPKPQDPSQGIPKYPLASSGRGFIPKSTAYRPSLQSNDQSITIANSGGFPPRNALQFQHQVRPFGSNSQLNPSSMRPPFLQPSQFGQRAIGATTASAPMRTSPAVTNSNKTPPFQSPASGNGYRDSRNTKRDDTLVTINHRKVRLSEDASLYALCRSWVRNGLPKGPQPRLGEGLKLLPRPLPVNVANTRVPEKTGSGDEGEEKEEDVTAVENLSARELLQGHVRRAKKVRAQLRKERLQRIERYKQRLALLLPSPVEQSRNETTTEN
ncbi:proline-rich family protein [Thalictrum thalictroides]|uniref:Proline-rich family protein n=1 Tax=Thalictrum thalictroides TaxID=46969 RepID=A0A7J6V187_THATH|nr:proline-rich family protein [Thalictrum thalictroides]